MKRILRTKTALLLIAANVLGVVACRDKFLEVLPTGQVAESVLLDQKGVDGLLIGAYSSLNGKQNGGWFSGPTNWLWGSIRGGDANKGTDAGDFSSMNPIQRFELDATNGEPLSKWRGSFEGVARANAVLKAIPRAKDIPAAVQTRFEAEARFLRGHYYFELKKTFGKAPWIDETLADTAAVKVSDTEDLWPKIEADFKFAYDNLPETQAQAGRVNKWAAGAYYGKTLLYQEKWPAAKVVFDEVIAKGQTSNGKKYGLVPNFTDVFRGANENHEESVFAFQAASGTGDVANTNIELAMAYPYNTGPNGPGECCGFYAPSFELANSFRVTPTGFPLLDKSYRLPANELRTDQGILSIEAFTPDPGPVDPRLDQSIGRRYVMFLDWQPHPGASWIRDQKHAGPYTQKKLSYRKSEKGTYQDGSSWTPGYHSINYMIIRFADVLLMAAEVEIQLNNLNQARIYINRIRERAANPAGFVKGKLTGFGTNDKGETDYTKPILDMTQDAAIYAVAQYPAFASQAEAIEALRFERKLELALEGQRFFDLVRWGIAEKEINEYLQYEGAKLPIQLGNPIPRFVAGKHERLPIPQVELDLQKGVLSQNPNY